MDSEEVSSWGSSDELSARVKAWARVKDSADNAMKCLSELVEDREQPIRLRRSFAYLRTPVEARWLSARNAPPREFRPPATRLITSRGIALQFAIILYALHQKRGRQFRPLSPKRSGEFGWSDLVASRARSPQGKLGPRPYVPPRRRDQVKTALDNMARAQLVSLSEGYYKYKDFTLLDEGGATERGGGDPLNYRPPPQSDPETFELPKGFVTNGWVHILEDSEIALILMLSCGVGALHFEMPNRAASAIKSYDRVARYGLGPDSFGAALKPLERLNLLEVTPVGRHPDGRVVDYNAESGEAPLHRLRLLEDGFDEPAVEVAKRVFEGAGAGG